MCLYPRLIMNPKYRPNKKNGGIVPFMADERLKYVPIGCQTCMECRKQKANGWRIRLSEEIRTDNSGIFVTLTFSNESIAELNKEIEPEIEGYDRDNAIATLAIRRFLERYRKKFGTSVKHWLITELGHKGTENIHIHGIIFMNSWKQGKRTITKLELLNKFWEYGYVYAGYSMNEKCVNYVVKYLMKPDKDHPNFIGKVHTSAGIGRNYMNRPDAKLNSFNTKTDKTDETYKFRKGTKCAMPVYYRNKLYNEDQREILWLEKLDKMIRYVDGTKVDVSKGDEYYWKLVQQARIKSKELGYNNPTELQDKKEYEKNLREIRLRQRINNIRDIDIVN